ncbi:hypothetical protein FXO38_06944 [Capsicum annuum]|uniref:Uncharacterized protein n=1 Tax=Capsicum annuum TaxID=4072 RepID=A0A2G2ZXF6_CAPAN|nr:hypothetical protein FXO38_06944 [Capsicum annuum]KAF3672932.1 hypothetical protein FXO37_07259 [Capsicum annuum]PHT86648.1 hypothetical protein T459_08754 [Capsicum annuum]
MNMDEIPKTIYSNSKPFASDPTATFTVTTAAVVNFVAVASGGGSVRDVVSSKTVDESLEIQGKHSEAMVELFNICVIHQIFSPKEFSIEIMACGLEKHLKLDQREFLMNNFPPVCGDETRRSADVAFGLQLPEDDDRYVKNCRNGISSKETRHIFHRYANEDVSLGSLFIGLDVEHIDERSLCCGTPPGKMLTPIHSNTLCDVLVSGLWLLLLELMIIDMSCFKLKQFLHCMKIPTKNSTAICTLAQGNRGH